MDSKKQNLTIDLGFLEEPITAEKHELKYDVSAFLNEYQKKSNSKWASDLETFFRDLDSKVKIDINDEQHQEILAAINSLLDKLIKKLEEKGGRYTGVRFRRTGSMYAGVRVGRPYEADILLEFDEKYLGLSSDNPREDYENVQKGLWNIIINLESMYELQEWKVIASVQHKAGFCQMLQHGTNTDDEKRVGLLLDLIPVVRLSDQSSTNVFTPIAENYIYEQDNIKHVCYVMLYDYFIKGTTINRLDTGFLEHQLVANLNSEQKCGYRVAKYLLQSQLSFPSFCSDIKYFGKPGKLFAKGNAYDEHLAQHLFGYKPLVRSHVLKVFMLLLAMEVYGTELECHLRAPSLTLCLLDMLHKTVGQICSKAMKKNQRFYVYLNHPVLQDKVETCSIAPEKYKDIEIYDSMLFSIVPALDELSFNLLRLTAFDRIGMYRYQLYASPNTTVTDIVEYVIKQKKYTSSKTIEFERKDLQLHINKLIQNRDPEIKDAEFSGFCSGQEFMKMLALYERKPIPWYVRAIYHISLFKRPCIVPSLAITALLALICFLLNVPYIDNILILFVLPPSLALLAVYALFGNLSGYITVPAIRRMDIYAAVLLLIVLCIFPAFRIFLSLFVVYFLGILCFLGYIVVTGIFENFNLFLWLIIFVIVLLICGGICTCLDTIHERKENQKVIWKPRKYNIRF